MKTVTRQRQWPEGTLVVEISDGGLDYTNPGALVQKYDGEFEEFPDPRDAVETAIKIAQQWQADSPKDQILIDHGATGGYTMPFDGMELNEETFTTLREWASEQWDQLEKCEHCGEILGKERFGCCELNEFPCCSENCAEQHFAWFWYPDEDEEDEEE